ncbi:hypothetical protein A3Q56_07253, partial [Intoshia linei]
GIRVSKEELAFLKEFYDKEKHPTVQKMEFIESITTVNYEKIDKWFRFMRFMDDAKKDITQ